MKSNSLELLTLGIDAEVFLKDKEKDEIISAEGYVKGSKRRPFRFDEESKWFTTQLDNVLAEFTIPPAKTGQEFLAAINKAMNYVKDTLPANIEPVIQASANLDEKYLQTEQALMFGCDPDFNAYTSNINDRPFCEDHTLRSCGAHIHLGYKGIESKFDGKLYNYQVDEQRANIVKMMDLFISVPLVVMEPDSERKLLYGKAGAFRPKKYGLEYRTTSNWYLTDKALVEWVFDSTTKAFNNYAENGAVDSRLSAQVEKAINTNDKKLASEIIRSVNLQLA